MIERVDITDLRDEYVICRVLGHSWDENMAAEIDSTIFKTYRGAMALRCTRCYTERFDYVGHDLKVSKRYYRYPLYYNTIVGQGTRPNLRGEMFRRSLLIIQAQKRRNGKR